MCYRIEKQVRIRGKRLEKTVKSYRPIFSNVGWYTNEDGKNAGRTRMIYNDMIYNDCFCTKGFE